jgi:branched-chain amino acid transport system permease protein
VLYHENPQWIVSTLGASVVISAVFNEILLTQGDKNEVRPFPKIVNWQTLHWREVLITPTRVVPVLALVLVAGGASLLLKRTDFGRAFAAVSDDREGAAMRGISVTRVSLLAFALAGLTAGLGGFVSGPITQASAHSGLSLTVKAFVASAIGGLGTINGAVAGGIALGLIEAATVQYLDTRFQEPLVLVAFLLVLSVRPSGLMGKSFRAV